MNFTTLCCSYVWYWFDASCVSRKACLF